MMLCRAQRRAQSTTGSGSLHSMRSASYTAFKIPAFKISGMAAVTTAQSSAGGQERAQPACRAADCRRTAAGAAHPAPHRRHTRLGNLQLAATRARRGLPHHCLRGAAAAQVPGRRGGGHALCTMGNSVPGEAAALVGLGKQLLHAIPGVGWQEEPDHSPKANLKVCFAQGVGTVSTVGGLRPGCWYRAHVRAENAAGLGPFSTALELRTMADRPEAPPAPSISARHQRSVVLHWVPPDRDGGSPVTKYSLDMMRGVLRCLMSH